MVLVARCAVLDMNVCSFEGGSTDLRHYSLGFCAGLTGSPGNSKLLL